MVENKLLNAYLVKYKFKCGIDFFGMKFTSNENFKM